MDNSDFKKVNNCFDKIKIDEMQRIQQEYAKVKH